MAEFFHMGGYAGFVWTAWGVVTVVLTGLFIASRMRLKAVERQLAELEAQGVRRVQSGEAPQ